MSLRKEVNSIVAQLLNLGNVFRKEERLVVILVDMQQHYIDRFENCEERRIIPHQISVIKWCVEYNVPVIVLETRGHEKTINILVDELEAIEDLTIIPKSYDNGFIKTNLKKVLRKKQAKKLFFMGINAGACVKRTAEGAIELGFEVTTSDGVITDEIISISMLWYQQNSIVYPVRELKQIFSE